jgi:hypothetical protein
MKSAAEIGSDGMIRMSNSMMTDMGSQEILRCKVR